MVSEKSIYLKKFITIIIEVYKNTILLLYQHQLKDIFLLTTQYFLSKANTATEVLHF